MIYPAKRSKSRCPTHPGVLLRDDIIPAPAIGDLPGPRVVSRHGEPCYPAALFL